MLIATASAITKSVYVIPDMKGCSIKTRQGSTADRRGKGSWAKLIGGTIRMRATLYFLTFCGLLSRPLSSVSITDQLHSCVQGQVSQPSPNDLNTQSVSIIFPTPRPAFSSSHWDNALDVAERPSGGHFLSWIYCSFYCMCCSCRTREGQLCICSISSAYDHWQVCHRIYVSVFI